MSALVSITRVNKIAGLARGEKERERQREEREGEEEESETEEPRGSRRARPGHE